MLDPHVLVEQRVVPLRDVAGRDDAGHVGGAVAIAHDAVAELDARSLEPARGRGHADADHDDVRLDDTAIAELYAFDATAPLERLDPDPEYWEGKRGACVGVFQKVIAGEEKKDTLRDVLAMMRNTSNPQVEYIMSIIKKWCNENGVPGVG